MFNAQNIVLLQFMLPGAGSAGSDADFGTNCEQSAQPTDIQVLEMASKEPRILWAPDLANLCQKVLQKMVQIYPYKSEDKKEEVIKVLAEAPELLFRMQYYCEDKIKQVEDLPIDLQNRILRNYC